MKSLFLLFIHMFFGGCSLTKSAQPGKGPYLYYKITAITIELFRQDTIIGNQVILDTTTILKNGQAVFYRIKFNLEPNKEAERGTYPIDMYTKCSKEKLINFNIRLYAPNNEVFDNTSILRGLDSALHYKKKPFFELELRWYNFSNVSDFENKFNSCHPDVQRGLLLQHGLILYDTIHINQDGKYIIISEMNFSDNRTIKGELKVNGKVK